MSSKEKGVFLEKIVEILEKSLSDGNTHITRNKKIIDLDGVEREVDIYIEAILNKRKYNTIIECKNYKSPITMEKIEAFNTKCLRLPHVHKKIFLSTSEYQSGATIKAKSCNIELYQIKKNKINLIENTLNISKIYLPEKQCKILGLKIISKELIEKEIAPDSKLNLYFKDFKVVTDEYLNEIFIKTPQIWGYLSTRTGFLLNYKKVIYPYFDLKGIYTKVKDELYLVDSIRLKLQIEFKYTELEIKELQNYFSHNDNVSLAIFANAEFIVNNETYNICFVKTEDDDKPLTYVSSINNRNPIKLDYLGKLDGDVTKQTIHFYNNISVRNYEFNTKNDLTQNIPIADGDESQEFGDKNKSQVLIGITENKIFYMIPILHNDKLISGKFPEPISLFFNHSIDLYNKCIEFKSTIAIEDVTDHVIIINDNDYHQYIQYFTSSIFMLHSAVELFLNFCYNDDLKINLRDDIITKEQFQNHCSLKDKLKLLHFINTSFDYKKNEELINLILELTTLKEELQNLKTSDNLLNQPFIVTFETLLNFDMIKCFDLVKLFFKELNPNFKIDDI
ncbi:restriction endonuclease [Elizabethkingia miricola]|uniref:restriction endonuclease n=1 Tax=Elizabethkingia miricola TaxID=172045 RepID=UPI0020139B44|nr:restriction endonuclease [Elizabethkingia miricola]MCL1679723.1 restriction endonuclease [Elizabethkingia miricola]